MFQCSQQIGVVCSCKLYCVLPVSIGNHCKLYCEVCCIQRYVNRAAHPVPRYKQRLSERRCNKIVLWSCFFFLRKQKIFSIFCVFGFHRSQASQPLGNVQRMWLCCERSRLLLGRLRLFVRIVIIVIVIVIIVNTRFSAIEWKNFVIIIIIISIIL